MKHATHTVMRYGKFVNLKKVFGEYQSQEEDEYTKSKKAYLDSKKDILDKMNKRYEK